MFTTPEMRIIMEEIDGIESKHESDGFFPTYEDWEIERLKSLSEEYATAKTRAGL